MASGTPLTLKASKATKEKDEIGQNIQVFVRCRPLNQTEKDKKAFSIVDIPSIKQIDVKEKPNTNLTKSYQFDRVFGPKSQQLDVYKSVVEPLIQQVMTGYNCTVFAYGQTGTGKTFTMEGGEQRGTAGVSWDSDPTSGIIPRALAQILDTLKEQSDQLEYSVKISFLELYNEEIFDLLSSVDDTSKLRLYEDAYKKGSVIIQGLEEVQVHTKSQVYSILERGSEKRKTAETMMNAHSSRSHTVFTVTVHVKEAMLEEEVMRIGKLNLVDLAGSENIGRSGAKDGRAREAGNINQSLLTLGRVITNLVERAPHIPYRESKLTRLLQDSLGGRTKTSIIATVSPATINLEETLSTLDYAYRARSILNRPEINAKLSKDDLVKEYSSEVERIRRDIMKLRDENGVYIAQENWIEMIGKVEQNEILVSEKTKEMIALTEEMEKKKLLFEEVEKTMILKSREIQKVKDQLEEKEEKLTCVTGELKKTVIEKEEQEHLVSKHMETELKLGMQAKKLLVGCDDMDTDLSKLHKKLEAVKLIDGVNETSKTAFEEEFDEIVALLGNKIEKFGNEHEKSCLELKENLNHELTIRSTQISELIVEINELLKENESNQAQITSGVDENAKNALDVASKIGKFGEELIMAQKARSDSFVDKMMPKIKIISEKVGEHATALEDFSRNINENFEQIKAKVRKDTKNVVNIVLEIDQIVRDHHSYESEAVEKINKLNEQVLQSHDKMKQALAVFQSAYTEHNDKVQTLANGLDGAVNDMAKKVSPMKKTIVASFEKASASIDDVKKEVRDKVEECHKQAKKSVDDCEEIVNDISKVNQELKTNSSTYVSDSINSVESVFNDVEETFKRRQGSLEVVKEGIRESTKKSKDGLQESETKIITKLDMKNDSKMKEGLDSLASLSKINAEDIKENIGNINVEVKHLLNEGIVIYQPSGETPVRTERHYPRYLASTSPHARILEKFRKNAVEAEEAGKTPFEESLDSAVSDSFRTNVTDDQMRDRTGSFSSDITQDADSASVASSISKKRELKKPEAINKNILGKSNAIKKA